MIFSTFYEFYEFFDRILVDMMPDLSQGPLKCRFFSSNRPISELRRSCGTIRSIDPLRMNPRGGLEALGRRFADSLSRQSKILIFSRLLKQPPSNRRLTWWNDLTLWLDWALGIGCLEGAGTSCELYPPPAHLDPKSGSQVSRGKHHQFCYHLE